MTPPATSAGRFPGVNSVETVARESEAWAWLRRAPAGLLPDVLVTIAITVFAQVNLVYNLDNSTPYGPPSLVAASTLIATAVLALRRVVP
jgi:hypothetical protein